MPGKETDPTVELAEAVLARVREREQLVTIRHEDGTCAECKAADGHEPGCVFKKIEQEIQEAEEEWVSVVAKIAPAQKEYDRAIKDEAKHRTDRPLPDKVAKATERALSTLWGWMDRKVVLEETIKRLRSTTEIERRKGTNNRIKEARMASNSNKQTAKDRGVPGAYLGAGGNFKPGLDARYKSDLITSALGEKIGPKGLHQFTKESAIERLQERGWMSHLDRAKKNREAKAAKAAEKAKATPRARSSRSSTKSTTKASPRKRGGKA